MPIQTKAMCPTCGQDTGGPFAYDAIENRTFWCDQCGSIWGDGVDVIVPKSLAIRSSVAVNLEEVPVCVVCQAVEAIPPKTSGDPVDRKFLYGFVAGVRYVDNAPICPVHTTNLVNVGMVESLVERARVIAAGGSKPPTT